ncbi:uncharacterized protein BXIN_2937 [Babesia sp. Xinjiang]|uniref:uncharacterized protein n=1 Tax=Babesia sp. Xinjiang TaxID=462227 RepID=UPI000A253B88|nr:uncharacterized protein BXIN_2937 [Babesia sp. Xinjiang]ORM39513.1 hypothetical protein BXIN_2937 [Babesia sp. Xinjiang]
MVEVLPQLCAAGEKHTLVANVIFHFLGSSNRPSDAMTRYFTHGFMEALNYVYSDKSFLEPPLSVSSTPHARELIFAPLNRKLVKEVSPAMHPQPLEALTSGVEDALRRFAMYNTRAKEYVCVNGLFRSVGAMEFSKSLRVLRLQHKLSHGLEAQTVNEFFAEKLSEDSDLARLEAVDMTMLLLHQLDKDDLYYPFVPGSWRPADVLKSVIEAESRVSLDLFFSKAPQQAKAQACDMMRTTDRHTGLLKYPWAYIELQRLLSSRPGSALVEDASGTTAGLDLAVEDFELHRTVNGIDTPHVVDTIADVRYVLKVLRNYAHKHAEGHDCLVAVHVERDAASLSTTNHTFIIDLFVTDPLYQRTLFDLFAWLWSNSSLLKVGYNLLPKVAKLATQFNRPFTAFSNMIDLRNKRVKEELGANSTVRFKAAGISKNLRGLMQEYNITLIPFNVSWTGHHRPICSARCKYMENLSTGILSIEERLRADGWFPTDCCDLESYTNERACEEYEQRIQDALL